MRHKMLPMHMPGHKRRPDEFFNTLPPELKRVFALDITEIHGADNLHDMRGELLNTARLAARLYGAGAAFPMINGSTGGILAAVRAVTKASKSAKKSANPMGGGSLIISRASHRSVYNAAELCGLEPVGLADERGYPCGVSGGTHPDSVRRTLDAVPDARGVLITSPTYEGLVSDIAAIAELVHARGLPLIVDAAHGAHLGFMPEAEDAFPQNASRLGADIEIVSLHKTLPALTQTALALVSGGLIDPRDMERELRVFESSSPSYVLLESITACLRLLESRGAELFTKYRELLRVFYEKTRKMNALGVLDKGSSREGDAGKIVITTHGAAINGRELSDILRDKYEIELEMAAPGYALAMTSIFDTEETLGRLADALLDIDKSIQRGGRHIKTRRDTPRRAVGVAVARELSGERAPIDASAGMTALEYIWAYPPGVPIIVPGEIIDDDAINAAREYRDAGIALQSDNGELPLIYARRE
ncbi:MAG: decarboxylase [Oscillospiraceae bacterium]|jgi:arginine/lysine/ornithine decarboxylase|nr:decarboxylase [Oscillospiraceae bacterium]